jgi:hypothetical protein
MQIVVSGLARRSRAVPRPSRLRRALDFDLSGAFRARAAHSELPSSQTVLRVSPETAKIAGPDGLVTATAFEILVRS